LVGPNESTRTTSAKKEEKMTEGDVGRRRRRRGEDGNGVRGGEPNAPGPFDKKKKKTNQTAGGKGPME
jgi:hypothetical protein